MARRLAYRQTSATFWCRVERRGPTDCWEWTGHRNAKGYGRLSWHGRLILAHRVAWELTNGPIPDGLFACHHCDNPPCCNPGHLFLGTNGANLADMRAKGRAVYLRGERNSRALLTDGQVVEIRDRFAAGENQIELGEAFGVDRAVIGFIVRGDTWKHVGGPRTHRGRGAGRRRRKVPT